jgi:hypothetical protein
MKRQASEFTRDSFDPRGPASGCQSRLDARAVIPFKTDECRRCDGSSRQSQTIVPHVYEYENYHGPIQDAPRLNDRRHTHQ